MRALFSFVLALFMAHQSLLAKTIELTSPVYVNHVRLQEEKSLSKNQKISQMMDQLSLDKEQEPPMYYYEIQHVDANSGVLQLQDGTQWLIGWWYRSELKSWKIGDRIQLSYHEKYVKGNYLCFKNKDRKQEVWGVFHSFEKLNVYVKEIKKVQTATQIALSNGWAFERQSSGLSAWGVDDLVVVLSQDNSTYSLWNLTEGYIYFNFKGVVLEDPVIETATIDLKVALELEKNLNRRVIGQADACHILSQGVLNYCAGLKDTKMPIGVFLFLGPTGVGKTEMAKVLAQELYQDSSDFIRFDMGHFSEPHSLARLIGSPPGYVNHEEGGQLTEALKKKPNTIVLLDEIEKAHPTVHKVFLPVFDEGYVTDSKDEKVLCNHAIFIMTSNLCSVEIQKLFHAGYSSEEILALIEPTLMERLSPEIYNRVEAVVFHPLDKKAIVLLVDNFLDEIVKKLQLEKSITLTIDSSVKDYLIENGYHPTLGARPLKKLIQKKVMATLAHAIVSDDIPNGSQLLLTYEENEDSWSVVWSQDSES